MADNQGIPIITTYPLLTESTPTLNVVTQLQQHGSSWHAVTHGAPGATYNASDLDYHRPIEQHNGSDGTTPQQSYSDWSQYDSGQEHIHNQSKLYIGRPDKSPPRLNFLANHSVARVQRSASLDRQVAYRLGFASQRRLNTATNAKKSFKKALSNDPRSIADRAVRRKPKESKHLHCPELGCTEEFYGRWELERHRKALHGLEPAVGDQRRFKCIVEDCNRQNHIWPRADKLRNHIRQDHSWIVDVEAQVLASAIVGSVEGQADTEDNKLDAAQTETGTRQYPTPDSTIDRSRREPKDSASTSEYSNEHCQSSAKAQHVRVSSLLRTQQSDKKNLTRSHHVQEETEYNSDASGHRLVVDRYKRQPTVGNLHTNPLNPLESDSNSRPRSTSVINWTSEPVDGNDKGKQREAALSSSGSTTSHAGSAPRLIPSGLRKRKNRGDDPPPDPPPGAEGKSSTKPGADVCGFCCAFYNNPRPCRWDPHRKMCHRFVSELKRFHEMHGLFYCGVCFTDFANKNYLTAHERTSCNRYRCFVPDCPDWSKLVDAGCPHHSRKNSQDEIYQYLRLLAWRFRERQDTTSATPAAAPRTSQSGIPPTTIQRQVRSASTVSHGSTALLSDSFDTSSAARDHRDIVTPPGPERSLQDQSLLSPLLSLSLSPQISSLERLNAIMWDRLEAAIQDVDENLTTYYRENIFDDRQVPMPPYPETELQYQARVLGNLARQLWNELRGISRTPRNELRDRVDDRIGEYLARRANRAATMRTPNSNLNIPIDWNAVNEVFPDFINPQAPQPFELNDNNAAPMAYHANANFRPHYGPHYDGAPSNGGDMMQLDPTTIAPLQLHTNATLPQAAPSAANTLVNPQQTQRWPADGSSVTGTLNVQNLIAESVRRRQPTQRPGGSMRVNTDGGHGETSPTFGSLPYLDHDEL